MRPVQSRRRRDIIILGIVTAAIFMNFALAILNSVGFGVSSTTLIVVEALILVASMVATLVYGLTMPPLFVLMALSVSAGVIVSGAYHGSIYPKSLVDFIIIPMFSLLGLSLPRISRIWLNLLICVVAVCCLVEAFLPTLWISIVNPLSFYRATRVWVAASDAGGGDNSGLYIGAMRSSGSFFSLVDHRVGGPFLEPLSLGYFSLLASFYYAQFYSDKRRVQAVFILICIVMALMSDTRIAVALIPIVWASSLVRYRFPKAMLVAVPIAVFLAAGIAYVLIGEAGVGDASYRLSLTFDPISSSSLVQLLTGDVPIDNINDSGDLYVIYFATIFGFVPLMWLCSGALLSDWRINSAVPLFAGAYLAVTSLFGGAEFSIKTAALLGLMIGSAARQANLYRLRSERRPLQRPVEALVPSRGRISNAH